MARRKTLPQVSPKVAAELRPLVSAIKEIIETGEGVRGDPLDRKLTLRDLVDSGIGKLRAGSLAGSPNALEPNPVPPNRATPPAPSGLNAIGGFNGRIDLTWTIPGSLYGNHAYTNVYRAETDNFANAILVGREAGSFYTDNVRDDATTKTYYYWITFTSDADVEGPANSTAGTAASALEDVAYLLETLTDNLADAPTTLGAPDETLILHADRFALRTGPAEAPVYPLVVADVNGTPTVVLDAAIIRDGSIQEGQIGAITFGKIEAADGTPITTVGGKLKADYIEADALTVQDGSITNAKIANAAITSAKIADGEITNAKIANAAITTAKIGNAQITGAKIGTAEVDTLQLRGDAVTVPSQSENSSWVSIDSGSTGWKTILTLTVYHGQSGTFPCLVVAGAQGYTTSSNNVGDAGWRLMYGSAVVANGSMSVKESLPIGFSNSSAMQSIPNGGALTLQVLYLNPSTDLHRYKGFIVSVGLKR